MRRSATASRAGTTRTSSAPASSSGRRTGLTRTLPADAAGLAEAAALVRAGSLVAFPTETVYGLGADATSANAVARVFAAKGRPRFNPLICHLPSTEAAFTEAVPTPLAERLASAFWPGPLTLVLPRSGRGSVTDLAAAGLDTLAVRVPANEVALALLHAVGRPVAAPSANPSGRVSPTTAAHVLDGLAGRIDAVLDGGGCAVGVESTVVDLVGDVPQLLRPGGASREAIEQVLGARLAIAAEHGGVLRAPGQLASHYAPTCPLRLDADAVGADEALLAFGPPLPGASAIFQLSLIADPTEAASRLFEGLRTLDTFVTRAKLRGIAAMPVPPQGLGLAIVDRLRRAAAAR